MVKDLAAEYRRYAEESAAYDKFLWGADFGQLVAAIKCGGGTPPYPRGVKRAEDMWQRYLSLYVDGREKAAEKKRLEERAAILKDPEKVVSTVVVKLKEAAPKTFGQELSGKPAEKVLEERLRNLPHPELVLVAAVLLKAPVISWLDAIREEETA